jgi:phage tail P2-like protein
MFTTSEATKCSVIAAAVDVHLHKGTVASVRNVLMPFGNVLALREWWEYSGAPCTAKFEVLFDDLGDDGTVVGAMAMADAQDAVAAIAPVRVP